MSHRSKDAVITNLKRQLTRSEDIIVILKTKLKEKFSEIAKLNVENISLAEQMAEQQFKQFYDQHLKELESTEMQTAEDCEEHINQQSVIPVDDFLNSEVYSNIHIQLFFKFSYSFELVP